MNIFKIIVKNSASGTYTIKLYKNGACIETIEQEDELSTTLNLLSYYNAIWWSKHANTMDQWIIKVNITN